MPLLFSVRSLVGVQAQLESDEHLVAFLDDIYVVCRPSRVEEIFRIVEHQLKRHAGICVHLGKNQIVEQSWGETCRFRRTDESGPARETRCHRVEERFGTAVVGAGSEGSWGPGGSPRVRFSPVEGQRSGTLGTARQNLVRERCANSLALAPLLRSTQGKLLVANSSTRPN